MDICILKPIDSSRGDHKLFVEVNNRGGKLFGPFNLSGGGNNPTTAADAGEAFLMNQGYSLAGNGWDPLAPRGADRLTLKLPLAPHPDHPPITRPPPQYILSHN